MTPGTPKSVIAGLVLCCCLTGAVEGQALETAPSRSLDARLMLGVYHTPDPLLRGAFQAADWSAYPLFVLSPIVVGTAGWKSEDMAMERAAYRAVLSETAAFVSVALLKRITQRMRPYQRMPDLWGRLNWIDRTLMHRSAYSMPSLHSALSYALATSFTLSYPHWYVAAPAYLWATAIAISRLWVGAHYPSDVLVGALIGAVAAASVNLIRGYITPPFLQGGGIPEPMVEVRFDL